MQGTINNVLNSFGLRGLEEQLGGKQNKPDFILDIPHDFFLTLQNNHL